MLEGCSWQANKQPLLPRCCRLVGMQGGSLKAWHWRKSSQWFGLIRRHVEVVLKDVEVFRR